jgi:hypothetical protein
MLLNHLDEDWADVSWVPQYIGDAKGGAPATDSAPEDWTIGGDLVAFLVMAGLVEVGTLNQADHDAFVPLLSEPLATAHTMRAVMHTLASTEPRDRSAAAYDYFLRNTALGAAVAATTRELVRGWWANLSK